MSLKSLCLCYILQASVSTNSFWPNIDKVGVCSGPVLTTHSKTSQASSINTQELEGRSTISGVFQDITPGISVPEVSKQETVNNGTVANGDEFEDYLKVFSSTGLNGKGKNHDDLDCDYAINPVKQLLSKQELTLETRESEEYFSAKEIISERKTASASNNSFDVCKGSMEEGTPLDQSTSTNIVPESRCRSLSNGNLSGFSNIDNKIASSGSRDQEEDGKTSSSAQSGKSDDPGHGCHCASQQYV